MTGPCTDKPAYLLVRGRQFSYLFRFLFFFYFSSFFPPPGRPKVTLPNLRSQHFRYPYPSGVVSLFPNTGVGHFPRNQPSLDSSLLDFNLRFGLLFIRSPSPFSKKKKSLPLPRRALLTNGSGPNFFILISFFFSQLFLQPGLTLFSDRRPAKHTLFLLSSHEPSLLSFCTEPLEERRWPNLEEDCIRGTSHYTLAIAGPILKE